MTIQTRGTTTIQTYQSCRKAWWPGDKGRCPVQYHTIEPDFETVDRCHGLEGHAGAHWYPVPDSGRLRPFTWRDDVPHVRAGNWPDA